MARIASHPWGLRARDGQRKYLNSTERARFLAAAMAASPDIRTFCLTLAYTGCRISEALLIRSEDVEVTERLIALRSLKKREQGVIIREVPVPQDFIDELSVVHRLTDQNGGLLWPWGRTHGWQIVKTIMSEAGIANLPASPKGLRHSFGVHAVLSGVPLTLIQKWLGHEDIETTAIYLNILGPEERLIAARMW